MLRELNARLLQNNGEWWSKLTDGLLASFTLILIWLTIVLAARAIERRFANPGLLVFALGLLAVSMFSLQQTLVRRHSEPTRAWYGIAGGFLAWAVVEIVGRMGVPVLPSLAGVISLIMVALIVGILWRSVLPIGPRFFCLMFLLNWAELVVMRIQEALAHFSPIFTLTYRATGFLAAIAALLVLGWILFKTRYRIQRISGAVAIWFLVSLMLYVFRGTLL